MATPVISTVQSKERELEPDELATEKTPSQDPRTDGIEDFTEAFEQYQIPLDLAENAYTASREQPDPVIREAFVNTVLDVKAEGDEQVEQSAGREEIREGVNDWKAAIGITGDLYQKKPGGDISASEIQAAVEAAHALWRSRHWQYQTPKDVMQSHPILDEWGAQKIVRAANIRAWIVSKVPGPIQRQFQLSTEKTYKNAVERGYDAWVDRRADLLLKERTKAARVLVGIQSNTPPHLLPSRQYRAAVLLTKSDRALQHLRPLRSEEFHAAATAAVAAQPVEQIQQQGNIVSNQTRMEQIQQPVRAKIAPIIGLTAHEKALAKIKEIQLATPVQYASKAADAMSKRIGNQLIERRPTIDLSAQYRAVDRAQATDAHRQAIEANTDIINAVREAGIPVNTGQATVVSSEKKYAPEIDNERQLDRGQDEQAKQTKQQLAVS